MKNKNWWLCPKQGLQFLNLFHNTFHDRNLPNIENAYFYHDFFKSGSLYWFDLKQAEFDMLMVFQEYIKDVISRSFISYI